MVGGGLGETTVLVVFYMKERKTSVVFLCSTPGLYICSATAFRV